METYEHVAISVGYAATGIAIAGHGYTDPWLYLAAAVGGNAIDVVDHSLYHLVYRRNDPQVRRARRLLRDKGPREALYFLSKTEAERSFHGLALHQFGALLLVSTLAFGASMFAPGSAALYVFIGALLLHMLTDVYGDFRAVGHADNWLWPFSNKLLGSLRTRGLDPVRGLLLLLLIAVAAFTVTTLRWGWELEDRAAHQGLAHLLDNGRFWLISIPLVGLLLPVTVVVALRALTSKYSLDLAGSGQRKIIPFSLGSLSLRQAPSLRSRNVLIQADLAVWVVVVGALIAAVLTALTALDADTDAILFLVPIASALAFSVFVHSTIGEWGGVFGLVLAWVANLVLGRAGVLTIWPAARGYLLVAAALSTWVLGLLGSMLIRGRIRMSVCAFSIEGGAAAADVTLGEVRDAMQDGLHAARERFYPDSAVSTVTRAKLLLFPYKGRPFADQVALTISGHISYSPIVREVLYLLRGSRLLNSSLGSALTPLPVLPRHRVMDLDSADVVVEGNSYRWRSCNPITLLRPDGTAESFPIGTRKVWSEFVDNLATRTSSICCDIVIEDTPSGVLVLGLVRERTTTKEYATLEAEAVAAHVMESLLLRCFPQNAAPQVWAARIVYPWASVHDVAIADALGDGVHVGSEERARAAFELARIHGLMGAYGVNRLELANRLAVWATQIAVLIGATTLSLQSRLVDFVSRLLS